MLALTSYFALPPVQSVPTVRIPVRVRLVFLALCQKPNIMKTASNNNISTQFTCRAYFNYGNNQQCQGQSEEPISARFFFDVEFQKK